jgi:hypothetical protein
MHSIHPLLGILGGVKDGVHVDRVVLYLEKTHIGKLLNNRTAYVFSNWLKSSRHALDGRQALFHSFQERIAESRPLVLVPAKGGFHVLFR